MTYISFVCTQAAHGSLIFSVLVQRTWCFVSFPDMHAAQKWTHAMSAMLSNSWESARYPSAKVLDAGFPATYTALWSFHVCSVEKLVREHLNPLAKILEAKSGFIPCLQCWETNQRAPKSPGQYTRSCVRFPSHLHSPKLDHSIPAALKIN